MKNHEGHRAADTTQVSRSSFVVPLLIMLVAFAVLGLRLTVWRDEYPGGDDDRRLLKVLVAEVPRALPAGARVIDRRDFPARWDACGDRRELGGWQPVRVVLRAELAAQSDFPAHLGKAGWSGPVFGARWVRRLSTGQEARLDVIGEPPNLTFVFTAQPPGPEVRGC